MNIILTFLITGCITSTSFLRAQEIVTTPPEAALSGIGIIAETATSFWYNPSVYKEQSGLSASIGMYIQEAGLLTGAISGTIGNGHLNAGGGLCFYGDSYLRLYNFVLAAGLTFPKISLGLSGFLSRGYLGGRIFSGNEIIRLGCKVKLAERVTGAFTIAQSIYRGRNLPDLAAAVMVIPLDNFNILIQTDADPTKIKEVKFGAIINVFEGIDLFFGLGSRNWSRSIGLRLNEINLIITIVDHPYLGSSGFSGMDFAL